MPRPPARSPGWRKRPPTSDEPSRSVVKVTISLRKVWPSAFDVWVRVLIR
jgi:hypothetical protein